MPSVIQPSKATIQSMSSSRSDPYQWSYETHRRQQARRGLELSAAERLRWLESTMEEMHQLAGRAERQIVEESTEEDVADP